MNSSRGDKGQVDQGHDLYRLVRAYANLGEHRTGTQVDVATQDWFAAEALSLGGTVRRHEYSVPIFRSSAALRCHGVDVEVVPLFYSFEGEGETERVFVVAFDDPHESGNQPIESFLDDVIAAGQARGAEAILLATLCPNDGLVAMNRAPGAPLALPVFLAAGRDLARLTNGALFLRYSGRTEPGRSANMIADFGAGDDDRPPIVVTTPLSGWFACAGERGTGIAIALSVAAKLATAWPVRLVAPSGHELGFFGAAEYLANSREPFQAVLHLGSCVAALGAVPGTEHADEGALRVVAALPDPTFDAVAATLKSVGLVPERPKVPSDPACWIGESELWCPLLAKRDFSMVSLAGASPLFHTSEDVPEAATSPQLLARMEQAIGLAATALIPK